MDNYAGACPHTCECVSVSSSSGSSLAASERNQWISAAIGRKWIGEKNADAQTIKLKLLSGFLCLLILFNLAWQLNR